MTEHRVEQSTLVVYAEVASRDRCCEHKADARCEHKVVRTVHRTGFVFRAVVSESSAKQQGNVLCERRF